MTTHTDADFERLSWHDCHIWGIEFRAGEPELGDWTSDLALDLDFIADWICEPGGGARFMVAPATLVFHEVTNIAIEIRWSAPGGVVAVHPASMEVIERESIPGPGGSYAWTIRLNWPADGKISFGATGFTQTLRAEPVVCDEQRLSWKARNQ